MPSASLLTRASGSAGSGISRSFLTHAAGAAAVGGAVSRSFLTRVHGSALNSSAIDAGQAQTVEPFTVVSVAAVVTDPAGGSATSWTVIQTAGPIVAYTQNAYSVKFVAPATLTGAVITFRFTAKITGYPDATDIVTVTVRAHGGGWRAQPDGRYEAVRIVDPDEPGSAQPAAVYPSASLYPSTGLYPS